MVLIRLPSSNQTSLAGKQAVAFKTVWWSIATVNDCSANAEDAGGLQHEKKLCFWPIKMGIISYILGQHVWRVLLKSFRFAGETSPSPTQNRQVSPKNQQDTRPYNWNIAGCNMKIDSTQVSTMAKSCWIMCLPFGDDRPFRFPSLSSFTLIFSRHSEVVISFTQIRDYRMW